MAWVVSFLLLSIVWFVVVFAVGIVLDLPQLASMRESMTRPHMKLLGVFVGFSPAIVSLLGLPARLLALIGPTWSMALPVSIGAGSILASAIAGSWLSLPRTLNPRAHPGTAILVAFVIWINNCWIVFPK